MSRSDPLLQSWLEVYRTLEALEDRHVSLAAFRQLGAEAAWRFACDSRSIDLAERHRGPSPWLQFANGHPANRVRKLLPLWIADERYTPTPLMELQRAVASDPLVRRRAQLAEQLMTHLVAHPVDWSWLQRLFRRLHHRPLLLPDEDLAACEPPFDEKRRNAVPPRTPLGPPPSTPAAAPPPTDAGDSRLSTALDAAHPSAEEPRPMSAPQRFELIETRPVVPSRALRIAVVASIEHHAEIADALEQEYAATWPLVHALEASGVRLQEQFDRLVTAEALFVWARDWPWPNPDDLMFLRRNAARERRRFMRAMRRTFSHLLSGHVKSAAVSPPSEPHWPRDEYSRGQKRQQTWSY